MSDIFLGYSDSGTERLMAERLARALEAKGYSVWFDFSLVLGSAWDDQILEALQAASCHIILWSWRGRRSKWLIEEATYAAQRGTLIQVSTDGETPPTGFSTSRVWNLARWNGDLTDRQINGLIKDVKENIGLRKTEVSADATAFAIAKQEGTPAAYANFLRAFPKSVFSSQAERIVASQAEELATPEAPKKRVFLSYRRDDSQAVARLLFERFARVLGRENVFFDVDTIPIGVDFRDHMFSQLVQCSTVLAVIGRDWVGRTADGHSRIDDETDFVRQELELAFDSALRIIPVIAGAAEIPKPEALPEKLRRLPFIQGARLDLGRDYEVHMDRLVNAIAK